MLTDVLLHSSSCISLIIFIPFFVVLCYRALHPFSFFPPSFVVSSMLLWNGHWATHPNTLQVLDLLISSAIPHAVGHIFFCGTSHHTPAAQMHDQKKKEKQLLSPEAKAAAVQENERVGALYQCVLASRKAHEYNSETLANTEALLLAVPEAYTVYNCRRLALEAVASTQPCADTSESVTEVSSAEAEVTKAPSRQEWLLQELQLNSKVLLQNYKNYNAFLHRHWILDQLEVLAKWEMQQAAEQAAEHAAGASVNVTPPATYELLCSLLRKERAQCEQLLQMDERNFHAWNYRRCVQTQEHRVTQLAAAYRPADAPLVSAEDATQPPTSSMASPTFFSTEEAAELAYTTHKIKNNFSNYSAWHQRSLAITSAVKRWQRQQQKEDVVTMAGDVQQQQQQAWRAALLTQLREDIEFLKQAVYCDPNDQSAWFYAPFVFQLLRRQYCLEDEEGEAAALEESFIDSVIELVAEADKSGTEDELYMPYYFLLDQLVTLQAASQGKVLPSTAVSSVSCTRSSVSLKRHITAMCLKVPSLLACENDEVAGDGNLSARRRCFDYLHTRLWKADTLRRCLYDDLFQRALVGCHS
ncbi:hypothetical protein, conserved [Leishmania tarentolae]|uniref:Geranylgeranyl transferase type-2 subunit alpha n=1 Tax=Leishmania tarentolae TaxID=5689 RepID=A0A640KRV6_LEITA|nr:hypothetical protein, conserved [Leishmania tarentolae]